MSRLDPDVPALLIRTGRPVWDYGGLATVRTLGRAGVDVFVMSLPDERELWASRYLSGVVGLPLKPTAAVRAQVGQVNAAVAAIGSRCVAIAGDDESAVLLAEQRDAIDDRLLTANVAPGLPRSLSDKVTLGEVAQAAGVPYPPFVLTDDVSRLREFARDAGPPLVVKSPAPYTRLQDDAVSRTTIVTDLDHLQPWVDAAHEGHPIFLQKYVTGPATQTWYAAGVRSEADPAPAVWTGRKMLAYPPQTGIGVVNVALPNPELLAHVDALCRQIGWMGPFDTDWVVEPDSGRSYLIDFNPRRGAQFRTFQTSTGLDVVRATHLALTGREVCWGEQRFGIVQTVENLALLRGWSGAPWRYRDGSDPVEFAWYARDDVAPARAMISLMAARVRRKVGSRLKGSR